MKRIFVCSPFTSPDPRVAKENVALARAVCREIALAGDAPFAPHLLYPAFLREDHPNERAIGIACGLSWMPVCDEVRVFGDTSEGMRKEITAAKAMGLLVRRLP